MPRKTTIAFLVTALLCLPVLSQTRKSFSGEKEKFTQELTAYMGPNLNTEQTTIFNAFKAKWDSSAFNPDISLSIIELSSMLSARNMRATPHFLNYLRALTALSGYSGNQGYFNTWLKGLADMCGKQTITNDILDRFFRNTASFISDHIATESGNIKWKIEGNDVAFDFDTAFCIKVRNGILKAFSQKDSTEIHNVEGKYYPEIITFRGTKGIVYFEKAGYGRDEVFAEIEKYSLNFSRAAFTIDSALLTHKSYFRTPEYGQLTDQASYKSANRILYPQFETYTKSFSIKNIFADVNYEGGLKLEGNTLLGTGDVFTPAKVEIFRNDTLYLKLTTNACILTKSGINTQESSATLYLDKDSLFHSSIGFSYNADTREVNLFRNNNPVSKSPWYDSFHGLDMYFETLNWKMNESRMTLSRARGASLGQARFESLSFFNANYYERLAGIDEYHPLARLRQFANWYYSETFPVNDFAGWLKLPSESVAGLCIDLANRGFLFYDRMNNEVTIKKKTDDFIASYARKKDYDVITFSSEVNAPDDNAILDMNNYRLTVNGVPGVFLSDSQQVAIYPYNNRIVVGKNRDIFFDGVVEAGLFTIFGHEFSFSYDTFKIRLQKIDSIMIAVETERRDNMGRPVIEVVDNLIQLTSAELYIDHPNNKSGLRSLAQYPIINATTYSYIFFDKLPNLENIYKKQDVYFKIDPFTYENIDHYTNEMMSLPGTFYGGNIIEPVRQNLIIQPDNSLGFSMNIPEKGIEVYGGKGRLYNSLSMSNKGLEGSGTLRRLTSETQSDTYSFYPDSMVTEARLFTISPDESGIYPELRSNNVNIKWLTGKDEWLAYNKTGEKFEMFGNGTRLDGSIKLIPKTLEGSGNIEYADSWIASDRFTFTTHTIQSDTADYRLISPRGGGNFSFIAENVYTTIDFKASRSRFSLNTGSSLVKFPEIQYICKMTDFDYDMKERTLGMEQRGHASEPLSAPEELLKIDLNKPETPTFLATNIIKDTIAFTSRKGRYIMNQEIVEADNTNYIRIADALIQPEKGRVIIERGARIRPLSNAVVAVNNRYLLHSASINIENKNSYNGNGIYDYIDENNDKQEINFPKITTEKSVTIAEGYIPVNQNFRLSPAFTFTGDVQLSARNENLIFTGAAGVVHNCALKSYNVKFKAAIDPKMVMIPYGDKPRDINDNPVYSGSFIAVDSSHIYPAFLSERRSWSDAQIVKAQGFIWYDKEKAFYRIASLEKLADLSIPGNIITFDRNFCILSGEGELYFGANYDFLKMKAAGKVIHNIDSGKVTFEASLAFDFHFSNEALAMMSDEIKRVPALTPVNITTDQYRKSMRDLLGEQTANRIIEETGLYGTTRNIPKEYTYELLLNDVKLQWNPLTSSFRSKGKIGIGLVGSQAVNIYVDGFIEIQRRRSGDLLDIYLKADNSTWYYFSYFRGVLMTQAGNLDYNTLISSIKIKDRRHPESSNRMPYTYMIAVEDRLPRFLRRMSSDESIEEQ